MPDPYENFLPPIEFPPDPDNDRRGFLRKAGMAGAAVAAAAVGGPLLATPAAFAAPGGEIQLPAGAKDARSFLPEIGQTINCSCNAFGATLLVNLPPPLPTLNFIGSIVVKVVVGGADYVRLQVLDHTVEAAHPLFGKVTIKLPDIDVNAASILKLSGLGQLVQTMLLSFNITFERCGDCEGPFNFATLEPAKLVANLLQFPPPAQGTNPDGSPSGGQLYQLQSPIKLGLPGGDSSSPQFAQLQGMNINVGSLV
ncbi:twin-arginine translocation signal domain-containing protein [Amycolatopsis sp. NPDC026612]|uniref:twin-arginine translocation signal domain-containing protein n=1 Tax=Amycolatopsis sp. NPDC026612 TaxID=3155466 RepID=UPI003411697B